MVHQPMITAELRNWWRDGKAIRGRVYNDTRDIYDDGDEIILLNIKHVHETPVSYIIECETVCYKADKDEQAIQK